MGSLVWRQMSRCIGLIIVAHEYIPIRPMRVGGIPIVIYTLNLSRLVTQLVLWYRSAFHVGP